MRPGALSVAGRGRSRRSRPASSACLPESLGPNLDSVPKPSPLKEPPLGRPRKPFRSSTSHLPWPFPLAPGTLPLPHPTLTCTQPLPGPPALPRAEKLSKQKESGPAQQSSPGSHCSPPPPLSQLPAPGGAQDSAFSRDPVILLLLGNSELIQPSHIFRKQKMRPSSRCTEPLQSDFPCFFPSVLSNLRGPSPKTWKRKMGLSLKMGVELRGGCLLEGSMAVLGCPGL